MKLYQINKLPDNKIIGFNPWTEYEALPTKVIVRAQNQTAARLIAAYQVGKHFSYANPFVDPKLTEIDQLKIEGVSNVLIIGYNL